MSGDDGGEGAEGRARAPPAEQSLAEALAAVAAVDEREVLLTENGRSLLDSREAVAEVATETALERRRREARAQIEWQIEEDERRARRSKGKAEAGSSSFPLLGLAFDHLEPFILHVGFSLTITGVCRVVELFYPLLLAAFVDTMRDRPPSWLVRVVGDEIPVLQTVALLTVLCLVLTGLHSLLEWLYSIVYTTLGEGVKHSARMELYDKLMQREVGFVEERAATRAQILRLLTQDCDRVEELLVRAPQALVRMVASLAFGGLVMLLLQWELAVVALSPLPFVLLLSLLYWQKVAELEARAEPDRRQLEERLANTLQHGMVFMKVFETEITEYNRVAAASRAFKSRQERAKAMRGAFDPIMRLLILVGVAGSMALGGFWVLDEAQDGLTVGSLLFFILAIPMVLWPVSRVGELVQLYRVAILSFVRMLHFMRAKSHVRDPEEPLQVECPLAEPRIQFNRVAFTYPSYTAKTFECDAVSENAPVLSGISFSVPEYTSLAIVGTRNSGKRTIVKLLMRLFDVTAGEITLGDIPIQELALNDIYKNVALITHAPFIFEGTVAENINYGSLHSLQEPGMMQEVEEAAARAQMQGMLRALPAGLHTQLSSGGPELSASEKHLLGIARALRKNTPILVMHEATSGIDRETEKLVLEHFAEITEGKTTVITTDKLSLARQAHRIIVLDQGEIVEEGAHDYLIARGRLYPSLWEVATGHCGSSSKFEPEYAEGDIRNLLPRTPDPLQTSVDASIMSFDGPVSLEGSLFEDLTY